MSILDRAAGPAHPQRHRHGRGGLRRSALRQGDGLGDGRRNPPEPDAPRPAKRSRISAVQDRRPHRPPLYAAAHVRARPGRETFHRRGPDPARGPAGRKTRGGRGERPRRGRRRPGNGGRIRRAAADPGTGARPSSRRCRPTPARTLENPNVSGTLRVPLQGGTGSAGYNSFATTNGHSHAFRQPHGHLRQGPKSPEEVLQARSAACGAHGAGAPALRLRAGRRRATNRPKRPSRR